jgi:hypothetical protein
MGPADRDPCPPERRAERKGCRRHRRLYREVRDEEHGGRGRADAPARGERSSESQGSAPRGAARRVCVAARRRPPPGSLRLRRWAHALGFRGHCFTKSRRYSTTFTRLREARHEHVLRRLDAGEPRDPWGRQLSERASVERSRWSFTGTGYRTLGDAWLAESGAARARERRRVAREKLRTGYADPVATGGVRRDRRAR